MEQSSIRFAEKPKNSSHQTKYRPPEDEDEDDLKDLLNVVFKGK